MVVKVTVSRAAPRSPGRGGEGCGLLLSRLARAANRELAAELDALGLRSQQFGVLHLLSEAGSLSSTELADALRVHASNLVRLLDELEDAGLIRREPDPEDRRRHRVVLSRRGSGMLARAEGVAAEIETELLAPLSAAEQRQLRELLGRVAAHACSRGGPGACRSGSAG
ncbi:MAG TPA: MarR family transcriptional regulator [Solirubrobacterales bacterium]|nr:MarR family transcriptional regulator [Solirubrobacterales bacterium]